MIFIIASHLLFIYIMFIYLYNATLARKGESCSSNLSPFIIVPIWHWHIILKTNLSVTQCPNQFTPKHSGIVHDYEWFGGCWKQRKQLVGEFFVDIPLKNQPIPNANIRQSEANNKSTCLTRVRNVGSGERLMIEQSSSNMALYSRLLIQFSRKSLFSRITRA
jgi:hypothetical protein